MSDLPENANTPEPEADGMTFPVPSAPLGPENMATITGIASGPKDERTPDELEAAAVQNGKDTAARIAAAFGLRPFESADWPGISYVGTDPFERKQFATWLDAEFKEWFYLRDDLSAFQMDGTADYTREQVLALYFEQSYGAEIEPEHAVSVADPVDAAVENLTAQISVEVLARKFGLIWNKERGDYCGQNPFHTGIFTDEFRLRSDFTAILKRQDGLQIWAYDAEAVTSLYVHLVQHGPIPEKHYVIQSAPGQAWKIFDGDGKAVGQIDSETPKLGRATPEMKAPDFTGPATSPMIGGVANFKGSEDVPNVGSARLGSAHHGFGRRLAGPKEPIFKFEELADVYDDAVPVGFLDADNDVPELASLLGLTWMKETRFDEPIGCFWVGSNPFLPILDGYPTGDHNFELYPFGTAYDTRTEERYTAYQMAQVFRYLKSRSESKTDAFMRLHSERAPLAGMGYLNERENKVFQTAWTAGKEFESGQWVEIFRVAGLQPSRESLERFDLSGAEPRLMYDKLFTDEMNRHEGQVQRLSNNLHDVTQQVIESLPLLDTFPPHQMEFNLDPRRLAANIRLRLAGRITHVLERALVLGYTHVSVVGSRLEFGDKTLAPGSEPTDESGRVRYSGWISAPVTAMVLNTMVERGEVRTGWVSIHEPKLDGSTVEENLAMALKNERAARVAADTATAKLEEWRYGNVSKLLAGAADFLLDALFDAEKMDFTRGKQLVGEIFRFTGSSTIDDLLKAKMVGKAPDTAPPGAGIDHITNQTIRYGAKITVPNPNDPRSDLTIPQPWGGDLMIIAGKKDGIMRPLLTRAANGITTQDLKKFKSKFPAYNEFYALPAKRDEWLHLGTFERYSQQ